MREGTRLAIKVDCNGSGREMDLGCGFGCVRGRWGTVGWVCFGTDLLGEGELRLE